MPSQLTNIAAVSLAALIVIWLGYPAGVWMIARIIGRPTRARGASSGRRVTVVVASRDDVGAIRERVRDALAADYPRASVEVVVGRDASGPDSAPFDIADAGSAARVVRGDEPGGKACALNAAVRAASGDILVFTDTAQRFAPNAIGILVAALADERIGAVSGALRLRGDATDRRDATARRSLAELYWRFERWLRGEEARIHSALGVTGAIYAMRRADWRPLPPGVLCDDLYIPMELVLRGYRIGFSREAQAVDERRFEAAQEYQRKVRTLTGVLQVCLWLPAVLLPMRNPIWLQFVCHKLLRLLTPYLVFIALIAGAAAGFTWLSTGPKSDLTGLVVGALALGVVLLIWAASRRARGALAMGVAMQLAVMRATWNGLRGDWDVWRR